jgi:hypothetical protein
VTGVQTCALPISSHTFSSFIFPLPSQPYLPNSLEVTKRQRDTTEFYENSEDDEEVAKERKINYNLNAPQFKPEVPRGDTQLVIEDDNEDMDVEKENIKNNLEDMPVIKSKTFNLIPNTFAGLAVGLAMSLINSSQQATLQQPFEFVDNDNKTVLSYVDNIFSCEGGFFSTNHITVRTNHRLLLADAFQNL